MRFFRALLLAGLTLVSFLASAQADRIVEQVRKEFAPDGRVVRFAVETRESGGALLVEGETSSAEAKQALLARLRAAGYAPRDALDLLPDADGLDGKTWGVVRLSAANMRSEPRHSAELSTQATLGTPLRVHKEENDWFLVQTPDGYFGWLDAGGFQPMTAPEMEDWLDAERVVFLPDFGFARAAPDPDADPVSDLLAGNLLRRVGARGDWVEVGFPDGRTAFVPAGSVRPYAEWLGSRDPRPENILRTARTFLGRPYLWGGTSGKGVDCSGFTKTVFYLNGLMLPRDASQQVHTGYAVDTDRDWDGLRPGDLLFFGRKATADRPERIVHVAIYQGDGRIIHAAGAVKENSLRPGDPDFNEYRYQTFVRARRVLDQPEKHGVMPLKKLPLYRTSSGE